MKNLITLCSLLIISVCGYGQENYSQESGRVTQYEMSMKEYGQDKEAEALVLYDLGNYYFTADDSRGFLLCMDRKVKIKIFKQAGTKYANFEIPYYSENREWESVENIKATTYNLDGGQLTKTDLTSKNIFEEKVNENVKVKKIALANVREGSVIEFSYQIITPFFFNMRKWEYQKKIPVLYSKLQYKAIPYYEYTYIMKGANKFDEYKSTPLTSDIRFGQLVYKEMLYDFGMKNLPAFKDEEFITSEKDYMTSLDFQISKIYFPRGGNKAVMTTWPQMCDDFLKESDFGKYIKSSEKEGKKILLTLNIADKDPVEQMEEITEYVKTKYNWNGNYGKFAESGLSDFMKRQTGNTANINLFLTGLLQAAGFEAYPVMLSTREHGAISLSHPFQQFFNYVITQIKINDNTYFIDATEPLLYYTDMPERCVNVSGLVVKPKSEEWILLRQKGVSIGQKDFRLSINPDNNTINAEARYTSTGHTAYDYRSVYLGKPENLQKYLRDKNNIEVKDKVDIIANEKLNRPFIFSFTFDSPVENTSDKLFIHPFCNLSISDNPFKQTSRTFPVDLIYTKGELYKSEIDIPAGYKVEYIPQSSNTSDNIISYQYNVQKSDNKIVVNAGYTLKQNVYDAKNYISLKMSFADMIKKFSEMIVLVKE
jgi:hypothetical protein